MDGNSEKTVKNGAGEDVKFDGTEKLCAVVGGPGAGSFVLCNDLQDVLNSGKTVLQEMCSSEGYTLFDVNFSNMFTDKTKFAEHNEKHAKCEYPLPLKFPNSTDCNVTCILLHSSIKPENLMYYLFGAESMVMRFVQKAKGELMQLGIAGKHGIGMSLNASNN